MIPDYYEFHCPVKVLCGAKALANIPYEMEQRGVKKSLVITDQGVVSAGLMKLVEGAMEGSNSHIAAVYDTTPPDSSNTVVNEIADMYRASGCDCLIAVGGGSCIDTAKGVNIVISEKTDDLMKFQGTDRLTQPSQPLFVIPTTAGTGSEVTSAAVIRNVGNDVKMPFVDARLYPDVAVVDPRMMVTMPPKTTAATGMDALTHAVEAYYCLQKNPVSDAYADAAVRLIVHNLLTCVENGNDVDARLAMANGALLAGIAFSNSMVGIVHALAHATGGICHVHHGTANAIYLPWGMEQNLNKVPGVIAELAVPMGVRDLPTDTVARARAAIQAVRDLNSRLNELSGMPITLREAGVPENKLSEIARAAVNDGAVTYNPEDVTYGDALDILKKAF
jgi:alcohol dehydrogenase